MVVSPAARSPSTYAWNVKFGMRSPRREPERGAPPWWSVGYGTPSGFASRPGSSGSAKSGSPVSDEVQPPVLLVRHPDGTATERARQFIAHTPFRRFGAPEELAGTLIYLLSDASRFVTGETVLVDGGFNAFSGV